MDSSALEMHIVLQWVRTPATSPFPPSSVPVKKFRLRHLFVVFVRDQHHDRM